MRIRELLLAVVGLCAAGFVACRSGDGDASPAATPTPVVVGSTEPSASSGCGSTAATSSGDTLREMKFGGVRRTYILHLPPSYDGSAPTPLVLNLHGYGSSGIQQATYSRFPALADSEGFIVVSPDGAGEPQQWNVARLGTLPDDIAFVSALLDTLEAELCIDRGRVFAAGMSNGAAFAQQLACAMPERLTAVAAVAALVYPAACAADSPIAVIAFHGTEDACVPFGGGPVTCGRGSATVPPIEASALNWARHSGCDLVGSRVRLTEHVRSVAYSECDDETAVVLFVVEGGGHTWPGSIAVGRLGATTLEIDATAEIWQFFRGQANLRSAQSR